MAALTGTRNRAGTDTAVRACRRPQCDRSLHTRLVRAAAIGVLGAALGCSSDTSAPAPVPSAQLYWALQLNQHAIVMALTAPYDTVQLTATPITGAGVPITGLGGTAFRLASTTDSTVTVSPTGLVTAHYVTQGDVVAKVIASLRDNAQGVTHQDTAFIVVTATPAASGIATFSMQPAPGDSAKRSLNDFDGGGLVVPLTIPWPATVVDSAGDTLCSVNSCSIPVYYHGSNPAVATVDARTGMLTKIDTGHVMLSAQTLVYGRPFRDSVDFRIGLMTDVFLFFRPTQDGESGPFGQKIVLGVGAVMYFYNLGVYGPIQITFDDPTLADSVVNDAIFGMPPTGNGNVTINCDSVANPYCFDPNEQLFERVFPRAGTTQMHISAFPGFPGQSIEVDIVHE